MTLYTKSRSRVMLAKASEIRGQKRSAFPSDAHALRTTDSSHRNRGLAYWNSRPPQHSTAVVTRSSSSQRSKWQSWRDLGICRQYARQTSLSRVRKSKGKSDLLVHASTTSRSNRKDRGNARSNSDWDGTAMGELPNDSSSSLRHSKQYVSMWFLGFIAMTLCNFLYVSSNEYPASQSSSSSESSLSPSCGVSAIDIDPSSKTFKTNSLSIRHSFGNLNQTSRMFSERSFRARWRAVSEATS
mmetsp:Transcript_12618/g.35789  ORF Transcript_12618/g.35789 Transcript_12618/m.35789 type:complete len:242 (-) Transcript_12618:171-896(-)